jgi:hypothetical protein
MDSQIYNNGQCAIVLVDNEERDMVTMSVVTDGDIISLNLSWDVVHSMHQWMGEWLGRPLAWGEM